MAFRTDTNLADLPLSTLAQLAACLDLDGLWMKIVEEDDRKSGYYSSVEELTRISRCPDAAEKMITVWGNRGCTVQSLMARLQKLGNGYKSTVFDRPQMVLRRKFKPLRWYKEDQPVVISISPDSCELILQAVAIGFPSGQFEWKQNDQVIQTSGNILRIVRCKCECSHVYTCRVQNEVEDGFSFSTFYRDGKREYRSELVSTKVDLTPHVDPNHPCDRCKEQEMEKIREIMSGTRFSDVESSPSHDNGLAASGSGASELIAADKVALIISNCTYQHLPQLRTPHCDAESLAEALIDMKFKTVVLADLTHTEMISMITEYRKLLGHDVYAVLYFAGHGFEVNGQCYLLPVDAPVDAHSPEHCISMDWVLATFADYKPALNLILLDVCRKFIPTEKVPLFIAFAEAYKKCYNANRNTVYGFSTSGGVGAYEVRGEMNSVFMKYLKLHVAEPIPVVDMLQKVFSDIEEDDRVKDVQIPELRTSLSKQRSLRDKLLSVGHTMSYNHHTYYWCLMHELATPVHVRFPRLRLMATVWLSVCGCFTNKVYVFSAVHDLREDAAEGVGAEQDQQDDESVSQHALDHLAHLKFPEELGKSKERVVEESEGISLCVLVNHLQRCKGPLECTVELRERKSGRIVGLQMVVIGHVLITRLRDHGN